MKAVVVRSKRIYMVSNAHIATTKCIITTKYFKCLANFKQSLHSLAQRLFQIKTPSPSTNDTTDNQSRRWRNKFFRVSRNRCTPQEMHRCFETHFLKGGSIRLNSNTIESLDRAFVRHVISN